MGVGGVGREGDWECNECRNRNYAFRSFCNRCKQPRLLVDTKTPPDSKWLPRIGDWICTGCTNNNYASREKCKKCGQPKEVAAMPAIAIPGASLPTHPSYLARAQGGAEHNLNNGLLGTTIRHPLPLTSSWPFGGSDHYGSSSANGYTLQSTLLWPSNLSNSSSVAYTSHSNQPANAPNGWRSGDWICPCGFHNYSSRAQCKKCNESMPAAISSSLVGTGVTALGTKRLASEELIHDWDNKRLNAGHSFEMPQPNAGAESTGAHSNLPSSIYPTFPSEVSAVPPVAQVNLHLPHATVPTIFGKGAKQWRNGDWMCTYCNNHNYASRSICNRCKMPRELLTEPVSVA